MNATDYMNSSMDKYHGGNISNGIASLKSSFNRNPIP